MALRWQAVQLPDGAASSAPAALRLVHVREETPPGAAPLEWFLLTSLEVAGRAQAERVLDWYRLRWRIEDWHGVLKSGCQVEQLGPRRGERIERAVTIRAVIAWQLTLLGRDTPGLPPDALFGDTELLLLGDYSWHWGLAAQTNPGRAVLVTAMTGGYLNRKQDPPPGHEVIREGYTRLASFAQSYDWLLHLDQTSNLYQNLPSSSTCG